MQYWKTPTEKILSIPKSNSNFENWDGNAIADAITQFGVPCEFIQVINAPQIATYHFNLNNLLDITKLKKPIAALSALLHCNVTQTGSKTGHFALVIPNEKRRMLTLRECMLTKDFDEYEKPLKICLGADSTNTPLVLSLEEMPHMLIAGATGSGKSVLLNSIITSMLFSQFPSNLQFVMIDPKKVELSKYKGLPFLGCPIAKDHETAIKTLDAVCREMDKRYTQMAEKGVKKASEMGLHSIVVIIDELADLMLTSKYECEQSIIRIAQLGRAAGIHLIIATQRPTVNVITGLIKSNIPCKIALQTSSIRDSITILDHKGAESLTGKGDALLKFPDRVEEIRFQSAFVSDKDIENVVDYWKNDAIIEK